MNDLSLKEIIAGVVVIGIFIAVSIIGYRHRLKSSWKGVIEKKRREYDEGGMTLRLIVRTSEGKKKRITVGRKLFRQFNEGDRVVKVSGEYNPKKA